MASQYPRNHKHRSSEINRGVSLEVSPVNYPLAFHIYLPRAFKLTFELLAMLLRAWLVLMALESP